jgi:probable rRNA maturation factor
MPNSSFLPSGEAQPASADLDPDPERPRSSSRLTVDIVHDCDGWEVVSGVDHLIQAAANAVQAAVDLGTPHATVALMLTSDAEVRRLNARWRGIDKATNVLSFPAPEAPGDLETVDFLGDMALACETVLAEAADQGTTPAHHLQHLVVHGLLHLLGYDHETLGDASEMEALEVDILARLGIADPYAGLELAAHNSAEAGA